MPKFMLLLGALVFLCLTLSNNSISSLKSLPEFKDPKRDTKRFISYYYSIKLTPEQQRLLEKGLGKITAPCCADSSALTC